MKHILWIFPFLLVLLLFSMPTIADTGFTSIDAPNKLSRIVCIDLDIGIHKTKLVSADPYNYFASDPGDSDDSDAANAGQGTDSTAWQRRYIRSLFAALDNPPDFKLTSHAGSVRSINWQQYHPRE